MRRSRMPELVAVDLRAQIAGCRVAVERMESLLDRYGAPTLKGVMRKIQDDSERAFVSRLETIPDGEWRTEAFLEMAGPGDRNLYRNSLVAPQARRPARVLQRGHRPADRHAQLHARGLVGRDLGDGQLAADVRPAVRDRRRAASDRLQGRARDAHLGAPPLRAFARGAHARPVHRAGRAVRVEDALLQRGPGAAQGDPVLAWARRPSRSPRSRAPTRRAACSRASSSTPSPPAWPRWSWRDGLDVGGWPWDPQVAMPNVEETESFYPLLICGGASCRTRAAPGSSAAATRWSSR